MCWINFAGGKPAARVYQGVEGIKEVYEKSLQSQELIHGYTDLEAMGALLGEDWIWDYARRRSAKGIFFHCLARKGPLAAKAQARSAEDKREMKFLEEGIVSGMEMYIFKGRVIILDFENACAFVIKDITFAKTQQAIWQRLWDGSQKDKSQLK